MKRSVNCLALDLGKTSSRATEGAILQGASITEGVGSGELLAGLSPREFYYSSQWQVLQENANNPDTGSMQTADQYVWGLASQNELVLRDSDSDGSSSTGSLGASGSGLDERVYALQDANDNVVALANTTGTVLQRFSYDPYGNVTVLNASGNPTTDGYS